MYHASQFMASVCQKLKGGDMLSWFHMTTSVLNVILSLVLHHLVKISVLKGKQWMMMVSGAAYAGRSEALDKCESVAPISVQVFPGQLSLLVRLQCTYTSRS
jgi:hypothetical protein